MYRERILIVNKFDIKFTAEISVFKFSEPREGVKKLLFVCVLLLSGPKACAKAT